MNHRLLSFSRIHDLRGNLTVLESGHEVPFEIRRVYYLYDVPSGASRAGHAHRELHQILIALAGSFEVILDDGRERERLQLRRPNEGLYLPPMVWRELENFSAGSVCLAVVSAHFEEADYYRNYDEFLAAVRA